MTIVAAGVIEREGLVLICQRRADYAHPLKWEFPGGKVENGEDPSAALARELWEELRIRAAVGPEMMRYEFAYPGKRPILLIFFDVPEIVGEPENLVFERIVWERAERLAAYDFLEGDFRFIVARF